MIDSIRLQNFRSYRDESFEFDSGVNIVIGPNASGKTNLLEGIQVLASGKSFRARDAELVQFSKALPTGRQVWARLDGFFGATPRIVKIIKQVDSADKSFTIAGKSYKRLSLGNSVPIVLFEPSHLQLITRGPEFRRDYFDDILERTQVGYKTVSANYRRALAQRNALLKQPPDKAKTQLFAWNVRLSELGAQIVQARCNLLRGINKSISGTYSKIAGRRSKVELVYESPFKAESYSSKILRRLEQSGSADFARGFTAHGPHREDIILNLNKKPMQAAASRGEIRSLLIALKIFELGLLEKIRGAMHQTVHGGAKPIFLLDDVFSELDGARRHHLVDYLKDYQTIITTTDADAVLTHFSENHKLISL